MGKRVVVIGVTFVAFLWLQQFAKGELSLICFSTLHLCAVELLLLVN
jgi:hypothetical protein